MLQKCKAGKLGNEASTETDVCPTEEEGSLDPGRGRVLACQGSSGHGESETGGRTASYPRSTPSKTCLLTCPLRGWGSGHGGEEGGRNEGGGRERGGREEGGVIEKGHTILTVTGNELTNACAL